MSKQFSLNFDGVNGVISVFGKTFTIENFEQFTNHLAYFEVEFLDEKEAKNYQVPDWGFQEVTNDILYKNGSLAQYGIPDSFYTYIKK